MRRDRAPSSAASTASGSALERSRRARRAGTAARAGRRARRARSRPAARSRGRARARPPTPTSTTGAPSAARAAAFDHQRRQSSPIRRLSRAPSARRRAAARRGSRRRRSARRRASRSTSAGSVVDVEDRALAVGDDDPDARERAAELVGGALGARRRPSAAWSPAQFGQRQRGRDRAAPARTRARRPARVCRSGPAAARGSGRRCRSRRTRARARSRGGRPARAPDRVVERRRARPPGDRRDARLRREPSSAVVLAVGTTCGRRGRGGRDDLAASRPRRGARRRWCGCGRRTRARSPAAPAGPARRRARARTGLSGSASSGSPSSQIAMSPRSRGRRVDRGAVADDHDDGVVARRAGTPR